MHGQTAEQAISLAGNFAGRVANSPVEAQNWLSVVLTPSTAGAALMLLECIRDRSLPVSDVYSHHRAVSCCHLANIALRLDRPLAWDPEREDFVGDAEASALLSRPQRQSYALS
jgi:hypothetical protein